MGVKMIETYSAIMAYLYTGLFLLSVLAGLLAVWNRIRKRAFPYWWVVPYSAVYSIAALCNTFIAYLAYDDISHPNYERYANWKLHHFILNDVRMLAAGLLIGAGLFFLHKRKESKPSAKRGCIAVLVFLLLLFVATGILSVTKFSVIELHGQ